MPASTADASYVPLHAKSSGSFLEGASQPEELVERAHALGFEALALTDRDGVYGVVRAHVRAREVGVRLIVGAEVTVGALGAVGVGPEAAAAGGEPNAGAATSRLVLLAADRVGYANLCRLITKGRLRSPKGSSLVGWDEVGEHAGGLLALWGGRESLIAGGAAGALAADFDHAAGVLREAFGDRLYALVERHREDEDPEREARTRARAARLGAPCVAATEVLYHTRARRPLQDVLTAIRLGVPVQRLGARLHPNAEHDLLAPAAMASLYADDPALVARTREVAARAAFSLAELRYRYPTERLPDGTTSMERLRRLVDEGAARRYGGPGAVPAAVRAQLAKELAVIDDLDYPGYFLTMWEVVEVCRARGILCQGRGSAANSAVCYCLGITAVDPVRMDLLFERFLSKERAEPPDIDLDIEHHRREEVIQHVYERYGRTHAAMVAVVISYRTRSAIRDVGKALGLEQVLCDRLAKLCYRYEGDFEPMLRHAGLDPEGALERRLVELVEEIRGFPRHLSIHPGGFLLGHDPVHDLVPIEPGAMEGRTVIQWDKDDVESLGLFKVDLLGLGALTVVHRALDLLRERKGIDLSMATIPAEDPATYEMIQAGDTVGVFQIESRAQMAMLPRLRPRTFYDLVIEVSIVRPGPIAGDMVHPYLRRRHGEEEVVYPHPSLRPVLEKTLGVPLFQEQVMRLAVVAADYTPGEADQLRRDMAAWRRSGRIDGHREKLIARMQAKGIEREFAERVFEQIRGFGEYGFPESHAASFALIAYATAWLKRHHPDAFACALLDAQPMGFYSPSTLVEDVKRHGVAVLPIDALASGWECDLEGGLLRGRAEGGGASSGEGGEGDESGGSGGSGGSVNGGGGEGAHLSIRMGLCYVRGLQEAAGRHLVFEALRAPFRSLADLVRRTRLDRDELCQLAEAGAFDGLGLARREALWEVRRLVHARHDALPVLAEEPLPALAPLDAFEEVMWDQRASQHSPRGHPLAALRPLLVAQGLPDARTLRGLAEGRGARYAGLVICRQRPGTAKGVVFLTLEDETGFVNVVLWEKVFDRFAVLAKTEALLGVAGKIQRTETPPGAPRDAPSVVHLVARSLFRPRLERDRAPDALVSRDFH